MLLDAQMNEALCHNIWCLVQSLYELGIELTFWRQDHGLESKNWLYGA